MSLSVVLLSLIFYSGQPDISGEWIVDYKTLGKRVQQEITIVQVGNRALVTSTDGGFEISISDDRQVSWFLDVPALHGSMLATFRGNIEGTDRMSGILLMSKYPLNGRAVRWKAKRRKV